METETIEIDQERYNFTNSEKLAYKAPHGLTKELIEEISKIKKEPEWMRRLRLKSFEIFLSKPIPTWGVADLTALNFDDLTYYLRPGENVVNKWEDVPAEIKDTFNKLGILDAEQKQLAGVVAQYESEGVYFKLKQQWEKKGVIFTDMDTAVQKYPELVKEYFMKVVPPGDNKFSALHTAVWSGGSFLYVPKNVVIDLPLQTYFRMNAAKEGQFEHTLIVAELGSQVHYIEGCTAPKYSAASLHSAVVEIYVKENARARYTTVQNWSKNVYNLNTKRAVVDKNGIMEWVGGSMGGKVSMLYPASILRGAGARAEHLNITWASKGTIKEGGAKVVHAAPNTTSKVTAKSISVGGGWGVYRGLLRINKGAHGSKASVRCDALILDEASKSDTFPHIEVYENDVAFGHEATVGKVTDEQIFYLMSRGLSEAEALGMIVLGFVEPVIKEIPLEYAVELNRLIQMEMKGSVG